LSGLKKGKEGGHTNIPVCPQTGPYTTKGDGILPRLGEARER